MSIGIRKLMRNKIRFQHILVASVFFLSILIQIVAVGFGIYRFETYAEEVNQEAANTVHSIVSEHIKNVVVQTENIFSFVRINNATSYATDYLNLRDEAYAEKKLLEFQEMCDDINVNPNIVTGFLVLGKNTNQKTVFFDFETRKAVEYANFSQYQLDKYGLEEARWLSMDVPYRVSGDAIHSFIENCDDETPEYDTMKQFAELCNKNYIESAMIDNVTIMVFLNENCFSLDLGKDIVGEYALLTRASKEIYSSGKDNLDSNTMVEVVESIVLPTEYQIITRSTIIDEAHQRTLFLILISELILINVGVYFVLKIFTPKLHKPIQIFQKVLVAFPSKRTNLDEGEEKRYNLVRLLGLVILIVCAIPSMIINFTLASGFKKQNDLLMTQYSNCAKQQYDCALQQFEENYTSFVTSDAVSLLKQESNSEMAKEFATNIIPRLSRLSDCSYFTVLDNEYKIVYQSIYSGNLHVSSDVIKQAMTVLDQEAETKIFAIQDPLSQSRGIVCNIPLFDGTKKLGYMLMVIDERVLNSYIGIGQQDSDYFLIDKDGKQISGDEQLIERLGRWSVLSALEDKKVQTRGYLLSKMEQTKITGVDLVVCTNIEKIEIGSSQINKDILFVNIIMIILCCLVAYLLSFTLVNPISKIGQAFFDSKDEYKKIQIHTNISEIQDFVEKYNGMIEKQNELQADNKKRDEKERHLIQLQGQIEFRLLQQQINPHFMFNTLECVNMLAKRGKTSEVSIVVKTLADILRYGINGDRTTSVGEEVAIVEKYLFLQRLRYEDRMEFVTDWDESLFEFSMVKFLLQPLVENAISHGLYHKLESGRLEVRLIQKEDKMVFEISDNGVGIAKERLEQIYKSFESEGDFKDTNQSGIGLRNVYKRLRIYYGKEANLEIFSELGEGTMIRVTLPWKQEQV